MKLIQQQSIPGQPPEKKLRVNGNFTSNGNGPSNHNYQVNHLFAIHICSYFLLHFQRNYPQGY